MPELPEVESARAVIERSALGRTIIGVDDHDTYECRPHAPGEIAAALLGRRLVAARRRGKSMWVETSEVVGADGAGGSEGSDGPGPNLGIHLGMSGRILVSRPADPEDADPDSGGDYVGRGASLRRPVQPQWFRFTLDFEDGGRLRLLDKRRLGRVRLDPDIDALGPDAAEITLAQFRDRVGRGTAPVKARLLDQHVLAGVGNLLADEVLWQARIDPRRPSGDLDDDDLARLRRVLRSSIRRAIKRGGVHTGDVVPARGHGRTCPRCGAVMQRATVGTRTTWWCPQEQR